MPDGGALIYCYDGTFEGLLCCVFEAFEKKEQPMDVLAADEELPLLLPVRQIETDMTKARRVADSIPQKMGYEVLEFIKDMFLSCHPKKSLLILKFMRMGYQYGPCVIDRLADPVVNELFAAVRHLRHEAHLLTGFIRFSETNGVLTAQIEPKNIVLPVITRHFIERYPEERFLIYDKTHRMALLYQDHLPAIFTAEEMALPAPGEEELKFRALWKLFYDTIEIKERHNPRCRMSHMPKRYWHCMTEFVTLPKEIRPVANPRN
jgi:probable DNA metabolism protein